MDSYETSATVEDRGQVRVVGVPFAPGTQVQVRISAKGEAADEAPASDAALVRARARMRELFGTTNGFRNTPHIPREELHDR